MNAAGGEARGRLGDRIPWENRFLLCAIAFRRTRQLKDGAPPRIAADGHKAACLAVLETLADTISWSSEPSQAAAEAPDSPQAAPPDARSRAR